MARGRYPEGPPARGGGRVPGTRKPPRTKPPGTTKPPGSTTKPPPGQPPPPVKDPIADLIDTIYGGETNALLAEIKSQRAAAADQAAEQRALMLAYAKWYSQNIPQQIGQIYGSAASTQGFLAKGFADGMQIANQEAATQANQIMDIAGAPVEAHLRPSSDTANVLYGIGGYMPGMTLAKQGAAFAGAAALMPGAIIQAGAKSAEEILKTAEESIVKLEMELAKLETKKAETGLKIAEARRAENLKIQIHNDRMKLDIQKLLLAGKKLTLQQQQWAKEFGLDVKDYELDVAKHELAKWKAANPNLKIFGSAKGGYWAFNPRTGEVSPNPIVSGTGEPLKIFGSGSAGYWGYDANTGNVFRLRPPTKKGKPASQKTVNDAWKMIKQGAKGYWAYQADPNVPLSASDLKDIRDKLAEGNLQKKIPSMTWAEFMDLNAADQEYVEDTLGIQYEVGDPYTIFEAVVHSGIGVKRAVKMVQRYFPQFITNQVTIPWLNVTIPIGTPGKGNAAPSGGKYGGVPAGLTPSKFQPMAIQIAQKNGIPTAIFLSLIEHESGWNPNATSHAGAKGLTQLVGKTNKPFDPIVNMNVGARYLKAQFRRFGRWDLALAAYNAGPNAVAKYGGIPPYKETQAYVRNVLATASDNDPSAVPSSGNVAYRGGGGAVREAFYDPIGAYDEGSWIAPIGGHSDHVHVSFGDPWEAIKIMKKARSMGLRVGENLYYDDVEPGVHTNTSYHYQTFSGRYNGRRVSGAADISGSSSAMRRFFLWLRATYLSGGSRGSV